MSRIFIDSRIMPTNLRSCLCAALTVLLVACGGGSGSNSTTTNNPPIPQNPPPLPSPVFSGNTNPILLSTNNATSVAQSVYSIPQLIAVIGSNWIDPSTLHNLLVYGIAQGSSGVITLTGNPGGNPWGVFDFKNYVGQPGTGTLNGELTEITATSNILNVQVGSLGFNNWRFDDNGGTLTLNGTLSVSTNPSTGEYTYIANLSVSADNDTVLLTNFHYSHTLVPSYEIYFYDDYSGSIDDSIDGLVTVSMAQPWYMEPNGQNLPAGGPELLPESGGPILISGAAGPILQFYPYNLTYAGLMISGLQNGALLAERVNWSDFATVNGQGSGTPIADTGPAYNGLAATPVELNALASGPSYVFQSYAWTVEGAPPGSQQAKFADPENPVTGFTPDIAGDYLLGLTVSTDSGSSHADVPLQVLPAGNTPLAQQSDDTGIPQQSSIGQVVTLDARGSLYGYQYGNNGTLPTATSWSLYAPDGSAATLSNPYSYTPTFVPDLAGRYLACLSQIMSADCTYIDVNTPFNLGPHFDLDLRSYLGQGLAQLTAVGDMNGDGRTDFVVSAAAYVGNDTTWSPLVMLIPNLGSGYFGTPEQYPVGSGNLPLAIADLAQNGLNDLLVGSDVGLAVGAYTTGFDMAYQQPDHTLGAFTHYSGDSCTSSYVPSWIIAAGGTLNNPLVIYGYCASVSPTNMDDLDIYSALTDETLGSPQTLQLPTLKTFGNGKYLLLGDFNGDGITDMVVVNSTEAISIYYGQASGGFSAPTSIPLGEPIGDIAIGDMAENGRQDIVVALQDKLAIILQNADGSLAQPMYYSLPGNSVEGAISVAIGDLNNDGQPDVAVLLDDPYSDVNNPLFGINFVALYPGTGQGNLGSPEMLPLDSDIYVVYESTQLFICDVNGDGKNDLLLADNFGSRLHIWFSH